MDEECLQAARRLLTLSSHSEWQDPPEGDASHSLYIKQAREVECSSSHLSPANTYRQAPTLESRNTMYRRQSTGTCVADIVRCVEYKHRVQSPHKHARALCDLIPTDGDGLHARTQPHVSRMCVELRVPPHDIDMHTYKDITDTSKESCTICSQSTPDVSVRPIKSCFKKCVPQLLSSSSLPSIHRECSDDHNHSYIQKVNTQDTTTTHSIQTQTDKVLHKISHDLDFLLNRTPSRVPDLCSQRIEEAPT